MLAQKALPSSWTPPLDHPAETREILYFRYHAYRRRQVAQLLHVMPRDGIRDLYAKAREWAKEQGCHDPRDPMAGLLRYAESILPLPPFEVWMRDREAYPLGHLEDVSEQAPLGGETRPGRVEERSFTHRGSPWTASLHVFRRHGAWRGFVRFYMEGCEDAYHTANIFREDSAKDIRERFAEFDEVALGAFLTSALP